jgi:hypothetical protein
MRLPNRYQFIHRLVPWLPQVKAKLATPISEHIPGKSQKPSGDDNGPPLILHPLIDLTTLIQQGEASKAV